jgi:hypothetical protein
MTVYETGDFTVVNMEVIVLQDVILHSFLYKVIQKSLWDFQPLRYSNRDGNAEGEHVNRGSFSPTLQALDMSTLGDAADVNFGIFGKFQYTERFLIPCPCHV